MKSLMTLVGLVCLVGAAGCAGEVTDSFENQDNQDPDAGAGVTCSQTWKTPTYFCLVCAEASGSVVYSDCIGETSN